jgi:hypothetical protein
MRCLCGSSAALVNIIKHNVDDKIRRIINTCSLDGKAAEVLSKPVPAIELPEIHVVDLECSDVLEGEQGHSSIEWELLVPRNQTSFVIRSKAQAWNLGERRIQIPQIFLQQSLLLLSLGYAVGSNA